MTWDESSMPSVGSVTTLLCIECSSFCNTGDFRGWAPLVALQIECSLLERTVEHEPIPMAVALGLGVLPWSPLGGGMLTGMYTRQDLAQGAEAGVSVPRKGLIASSGHMTDRALEIAETVGVVAREVGAMPSQVAPAWTLANPAVAAPVIGARTFQQAADNLGALELTLTNDQLTRPGEASAPPPTFPDRFMSQPMVERLVFSGANVRRRR